MLTWLAKALGLRTLGRRDDLDERTTVLALFARFADEVASGLLIVLMPSLRLRLGLTVVQVGWCFQALYTVAAVVEPLAGAALDLSRRRPWLVWGAVGWGASLLLAAGAPNGGWLVAAFAVAGAASGPLAHTADVILVEGHPHSVERIHSRATTLDTVGALLAPIGVAVAGFAGVDQRLLLVVAGVGCAVYAALLAGAVVPAPTLGGWSTRPALRRVAANVRAVLADRRGRTWLLALVLHELQDIPDLFEPVWLRDVVGAPQTLVAIHVALGYLATLAGLVLADRWLARHDAGRLLVASCVATLVLYPAWLMTPGLAARFALVVPRNLAMAPLWPILRSRALASVPASAGTVSGLSSLTGMVPLATGFGWVAGRLGLTATMLTTTLVATLALLVVISSSTTRER